MPYYYSSQNPGQNRQIIVFTLEFMFEEQMFFCLVRAKNLDNTVLYSLTLLNADMEEVFSDPYVLTEKERRLQIEAPIEKSQQTDVKFASTVALRNYLVQEQSSVLERMRSTA